MFDPENVRSAMTCSLSVGKHRDAPKGRLLVEDLGPMPEWLPFLMDKAYYGDESRQIAFGSGMVPVVSPKSNTLNPWSYNEELNKKRNEIDRISWPLKGFSGIFSSFEQPDVVFLAFIQFALIVKALKVVCTRPDCSMYLLE